MQDRTNVDVRRHCHGVPQLHIRLLDRNGRCAVGADRVSGRLELLALCGGGLDDEGAYDMLSGSAWFARVVADIFPQSAVDNTAIWRGAIGTGGIVCIHRIVRMHLG